MVTINQYSLLKTEYIFHVLYLMNILARVPIRPITVYTT